MAETALTNTGESAARIAGWRGIAADWSSDQRAFKNVSWGKAMMWISIAMHGEALRRHFGHPGKDRRIDGSLLKIGKQSGLLGPAGSGRDPLGHDRRFFGDAERHQNEGISERPLQGGQAVNDPQPIRGGPV